jgi:hypothetical protein
MSSFRAILCLIVVLLTSHEQKAQWVEGSPMYYNAGYVGIGTGAPVYRLHVLESSTSVPGIFERHFTTNNNYAAALVLRLSTSTSLTNGFGPALTFQASGISGIVNNLANIGAVRTGSDNSGSLVFNTLNGGVASEKLRITNIGNVGIGNSNPISNLDILRNTNDATPIIIVRNANVGSGAQARMCFFNNLGNSSSNGALIGLLSSNYSALPNAFQIWNRENGVLRFGTNNAEVMLIAPTGNVGIGSSAPAEKLDVNGNIKATGFVLPTDAGPGKVLTSDATGNATWQAATGTSSGWALTGNILNPGQSIGSTNNAGFNFITNNQERVRIQADGKVVMGNPGSLPDGDVLLAVNGNVFSKKVKVTQNGWADYVFDAGYRLRPLSEVEQFIQQHHHLPEVPSAAEVEKNGLDLGDNQATLLKKIEELTLYVIEQNKKIHELTEQNKVLEHLRNDIESLKKRMQTREQ